MRARRLPAASVGAVRLLLVPRVLPEFGGDPAQADAGDARAPGRTRGPAAASARHRLSPASRSMREAIARFDAAVDRAVDRVRSPALDGVVYRLSSAADHSLLWHAVRRGHRARARWRHRGSRRASRARWASSRSLTNGVVKTLFRRVRPAEYDDIEFHHGLRRPITSSFPSGHATAAFCAATPARRRARLVHRSPRRWPHPGLRAAAPRLRRRRRRRVRARAGRRRSADSSGRAN